MKIDTRASVIAVFTAAMLWLSGPAQSAAAQVLVTVGQRTITADQLAQALHSSPIATQFNTLEENAQAGIRGRMLKDLIYSEMLYQEGLAQHVEQRAEVREELESFRRGLLYQRYLGELRKGLAPATEEDAAIKSRLAGDSSAIAAARSASSAARFGDLKTSRLLELGRAQHLSVYREPLIPGERRADALLAKGDQIEIRLRDLVYRGEELDRIDGAELLRRLDRQVEHQLFVQAAEAARIDVTDQLENYARDLIRETVMREKERVWVPDRSALIDYYDAHPELSRIPEQWHVVQLVTKTRREAEALRERVVQGESLYRLASDYSIDADGRQRAGDMGWVRPDQAPDALRLTLQGLSTGELSPVIESPMGFHLLVVEERRPERREPLASVAGGIRRSLILHRLAEDYAELSKRYQIQWHLPNHGHANSTTGRGTGESIDE